MTRRPSLDQIDDELVDVAARMRQKEEQLLKIGATIEAPFPRR
jgi:hypothetical protein